MTPGERLLYYRVLHVSVRGAIAQLGERMAGSHEVRGSSPLGSTNPDQRARRTQCGGRSVFERIPLVGD